MTNKNKRILTFENCYDIKTLVKTKRKQILAMSVISFFDWEKKGKKHKFCDSFFKFLTQEL